MANADTPEDTSLSIAELEHEVKRLALSRDITREFVATTDMKKLMSIIFTRVVETLPAEAGSLWAGPGASGIGVDRLGEPIAELVVDDERPWSDLDLTEAVQYWVVNPGDNYGLLLLAEGGVNVEYQFASAQWWDQGSRPKLQVAHQVGASRAEPGDRGPLWPWLAGGGAGLLLLAWQLVRRKLHRSASRASGRLIR